MKDLPEKPPRLTRETLREAESWLRRRDPRLRPWMDRVAPVGLRRERYQFGALCRSIIAQQVAASAARTVHGRFLALFPAKPSPDALLALPEGALRACGLSRPKVQYLESLAHEFGQGSLRRARLGSRPDEDVVSRLTAVRGIGVWTAEMFLIFSLGRPDVFSVRDLALRNGVQRVVGRSLTHREIEAQARRWSPFRSVASLYLWKISQLEDLAPHRGSPPASGGASRRAPRRGR